MYFNASGVKKNGSHLGGYIYDVALQGHHYDNDDLAMRLYGPSVFFAHLRF